MGIRPQDNTYGSQSNTSYPFENLNDNKKQPAIEENLAVRELQNLINASGQSSTQSDAKQIEKAISMFVANSNLYLTSGTANAIILTTKTINSSNTNSIQMSNLHFDEDGTKYEFVANFTNTGAVTVAITGLLAAQNVVDIYNNSLTPYSIVAGRRYIIIRNKSNSQFILLQTPELVQNYIFNSEFYNTRPELQNTLILGRQWAGDGTILYSSGLSGGQEAKYQIYDENGEKVLRWAVDDSNISQLAGGLNMYISQEHTLALRGQTITVSAFVRLGTNWDTINFGGRLRIRVGYTTANGLVGEVNGDLTLKQSLGTTSFLGDNTTGSNPQRNTWILVSHTVTIPQNAYNLIITYDAAGDIFPINKVNNPTAPNTFYFEVKQPQLNLGNSRGLYNPTGYVESYGTGINPKINAPQVRSANVTYRAGERGGILVGDLQDTNGGFSFVSGAISGIWTDRAFERILTSSFPVTCSLPIPANWYYRAETTWGSTPNNLRFYEFI